MTAQADTRTRNAEGYGVVHVPLPAEARWRCAVLDHGYGTVVAVQHFAGTDSGYRIELDSGDDIVALPKQTRRIANLRLVQA